MRTQGLLDELPPVGAADHLCWVYDDPRTLTDAAHGFLAGGLARGERLLCVGDAVLDGLWSAPGPLGDLPALVERGTVQVLSTELAYDRPGRFTPEAQLSYYRAATRRAREEGYRGLRVVAEVTPLAADPATRTELVRWEHLADQFMAEGSGFTAMCAYDRRALEDEVVAAVGSAHPAAHPAGDGVPFRIFFEEGRLVLAGSVDVLGADGLRRLLSASPANSAPVVRLDLTRLQFADVAGCRAVAEWALEQQERGAVVDIVGAPRLVRRVWRLLGFDSLVDPSCPEEARS